MSYNVICHIFGYILIHSVEYIVINNIQLLTRFTCLPGYTLIQQHI